MRDSVLVHDLSASQLQVRGVDIATKQLVQSWGTGQNDGLALVLDSTLAQSNQVGTDSNRATGHQSNGEDVIVCTRGRSCNQTTSTQVLHTETIHCSNNIRNLVASLAVFDNRLRDDALLS